MATANRKSRGFTPEAWEAKKPLIKRIYFKEGKSIETLLTQLARQGFGLNRSMVLKRLKKWKFCRKNSWDEMCEGARQLATSGITEEGTLPDLIIRGRVVTSTQLLRYFRRKQIPDPVGCAMRLVYNKSGVIDVVGLVDDEHAEDIEEESLDDGAGREIVSYSTASAIRDPGSTPTARQSYSRSQTPSSLSICKLSQTTNLDKCDRVLWVARAYCLAYLESPQHSRHREPIVHRLTLHGRFQQHMQNGMTILQRASHEEAFKCFRAAFEHLPAILEDSHVMSLTLILNVICELEHRRMQTLVNSLLRHLFEMSQVKFASQHPFIDLFRVLSTTHEHRSRIIVQAMRSCLSDMEDQADKRDWKQLYVKERLCDCLYYAHVDEERIGLRRQLLKQQEEMYGTHARNVLWTLSNVADDALQQGDFDEAEAIYEVTLAREKNLEGYGRSKTRFAALEGLARTYRLKGEDLRQRFVLRFGHGMAREQYLCLLKKSIEHAQAAELEARTWFEPSSRRIVTAEAERTLSMALLRSMNDDESG